MNSGSVYINDFPVDYLVYLSSPWLKLNDLQQALPQIGRDTTSVVSNGRIPPEFVQTGKQINGTGKSFYIHLDYIDPVFRYYRIDPEVTETLFHDFSSKGFLTPSFSLANTSEPSVEFDLGNGVTMFVPYSTLFDLVKKHLIMEGNV